MSPEAGAAAVRARLGGHHHIPQAGEGLLERRAPEPLGPETPGSASAEYCPTPSRKRMKTPPAKHRDGEARDANGPHRRWGVTHLAQGSGAGLAGPAHRQAVTDCRGPSKARQVDPLRALGARARTPATRITPRITSIIMVAAGAGPEPGRM